LGVSSKILAISAPGLEDEYSHGAVFLYGWNGKDATTLVLEAVAVRPHTDTADGWGTALAVLDDRVAIGSSRVGVTILRRSSRGEWEIEQTIDRSDDGPVYEIFGRPVRLYQDIVAVGARQGRYGERGELGLYDMHGTALDVIRVARFGVETPPFAIEHGTMAIFTADGPMMYELEGRALRRDGRHVELARPTFAHAGVVCDDMWWFSTVGSSADQWAASGAIHAATAASGWREVETVEAPGVAPRARFGMDLACSAECLLVSADTDEGLPQLAGAVHVVGGIHSGRPRVVQTLVRSPPLEYENFGARIAAHDGWWFFASPAFGTCREGTVSVFWRVSANDDCASVDAMRRIEIRRSRVEAL
jgi:hypothetical protein